ncbi:MAG: nitrous oxide reductase family maturation protein NosD [Anaerolineales bacterium]|nr:nitrous oxide reductase family maturation protein NosD [Anaerolineales bacterium]MCB0026287.1 nitrous oxide reductase family maturation protein NosD [Anaerolineales bacterium]
MKQNAVAQLTNRLLASLVLILLLWPQPGQAAAQEAPIRAEALPQAIRAAQPGAVIAVAGGHFTGHLVVDKPLTLVGSDWPVLDGGNVGTVVDLTAPGIVITGFLIRGSGQLLDQENSGIAIQAENITVANNRFEDTLFGIYAKNGHHAIIRDNVISSKDLDLPRRGDPIRIWYSQDVLIEGNSITRGRDVVLWYSERVTVVDNEISAGRYGLHFMYCDDARIAHNRLLDNSVGAFMMYSRRVHLQNNTIAGNRGPSGYGVGLKDMDDTILAGNVLVDNRVGVHLDTSPREVDSIGRFTDNVFAYNDIGVNMMPSVRNNEFAGNSFIENQQQVAIGGGGQLLGNRWSIDGLGNYWSDYAGYDADQDGQGDISYESRRLFEDLVQRDPNLRLFLHSPATDAIDFSARAFPLVQPKPKVEDPFPLMAPRWPGDAPPLPQSEDQNWFILALFTVFLSMGILQVPRAAGRHYQCTNVEVSS